MRFSIVYILLFFNILSYAQSGNIEFSKVLHDFGKIPEKNGEVQYDFIFKNIGDLPVSISGVKANCGCTIPVWTRSEIKPGEYGFVKVKYHPEGRPGYFVKSLIVSATDGQNRFNRYLNIKGKVIPNSEEANQETAEKTKDTSALPAIKPYVQYYRWGRKYMDTTSADFQRFIRNIKEIAYADGFVNIKIESSASRVPSARKVTDKEVAEIRANRVKNTLLRILARNGLNKFQVGFLPSDILVQGPAYTGKKSDLQKYVPYQYVKIILPDYQASHQALTNDDFLKDSEISLTVQVMPEDIEKLEAMDSLGPDTSITAEDHDRIQGQMELQVYTLRKQLYDLRKEDSLTHLLLAELRDSTARLRTALEQQAIKAPPEIQDTAMISKLKSLEDALHVKAMYDSLLQIKVALLSKEIALRKQAEERAVGLLRQKNHSLDSLEEILDEQKQEIENLSMDIAELQESRNTLSVSMQSMSRKIHLLNDSLSAYKLENMKLSEIKKENHSLNAHADSMHHEFIKLSAQYKTLNEARTLHEQMIVSYRNKFKSLSLSDSLLRIKIEEMERELHLKEMENLSLHDELNKLSFQLDEMQSAGQQARFEANYSRHAIDSIVQTQKETQEALMAAQQRIRALQNELQNERKARENAMQFAQEMREMTEKEIAEKELLRKALKQQKSTHDDMAKTDGNQVRFRVQVAISDKPISLNSKKFKGYEYVMEDYIAGKYKYTIGNEKDLKSAMRLKEKLRQEGFEFAFVVAYLNDARISMKEAKELAHH